MKTTLAAALIGLVMFAAPAPVLAQDNLTRVKSSAAVDITMDALETAVEAAGATVFARVNHARGAEDAGLYIRPEELLIFGNPKLGSKAIQADPLAGLYLPMKVLVFEDANAQVWLVYQAPEKMFDGLELPEDPEFLTAIKDALKKLTTTAADG